MIKDTCKFGGIIKHKSGGYGFKTTFNNIELAQKYKEMFKIIINSDNIVVGEEKGYYDRKD